MRSIKKGQGGAYRIQSGIKGEVRLVEYCFHLGKPPLADAMELFAQDFQPEQITLTSKEELQQDSVVKKAKPTDMIRKQMAQPSLFSSLQQGLFLLASLSLNAL